WVWQNSVEGKAFLAGLRVLKLSLEIIMLTKGVGNGPFVPMPRSIPRAGGRPASPYRPTLSRSVPSSGTTPRDPSQPPHYRPGDYIPLPTPNTPPTWTDPITGEAFQRYWFNPMTQKEFYELYPMYKGTSPWLPSEDPYIKFLWSQSHST